MLRFCLHIVLLFPVLIDAQVSIINRSLIDSSLNVAYIGIDNSIKLIGHKGKSKITFSATNGTITNDGLNSYVLKPSTPGQCIVSFQSHGQNFASKIFRIDTLENLRARLAGITDSFASVPQVISNPFLVIEAPKSFYKVRCVVRSFVLSMDGHAFEDFNPYEIAGYVIPSYVIKRIKELRKGDWMWFDQIIMNCADCRTRKLPPFKIVIK